MPPLSNWLWFTTSGSRSVLGSPAFAAAALVTLALGIGASAIFSVVQAVLLTPLPYTEPDRRVMIWSRWVSFEKTWLSDQEIVDYRNFSETMTDIAAWSGGQQNLTGDGEALRVGVGFVTANTFTVLGASPLLGRTFTAAEDQPNGPPAVILSHDLWQTRFGGESNVIGRRLLLSSPRR